MSSNPPAGVISKKLKFKGEKSSKSKKRSRVDDESRTKRAKDGAREDDGDDDGEDGMGWTLPKAVEEAVGPAFIIFPTDPPTCLAWEATRQRVYAAPLDLPEGSENLPFEQLVQIVEPTEVGQVWVISRLSGSEDVISLRSSSGTFLTASPSAGLSAITPSRGPLESLTPILSKKTDPSSSSSSSSTIPSFSLKTQSGTYLSVTRPSAKAKLSIGGSGSAAKSQFEIRADSESLTKDEEWVVKCQREYVLKARIAANGESGSSRIGSGSGLVAGGGRVVDLDTAMADLSDLTKEERRELKRARKEGRLNEVILDKRSKQKHDHFC